MDKLDKKKTVDQVISLKKTMTVGEACKQVGIKRSTYSYWKAQIYGATTRPRKVRRVQRLTLPVETQNELPSLAMIVGRPEEIAKAYRSIVTGV